MNRLSTLLLGAALAAMPVAARADVAIVSTTGGTAFNAFALDETVGFTFDVLEDIDVTALGWNAAGGSIDSNHRVGIWNTSGTLLASTVVTSASATLGGFGYSALAGGPLRLTVGSYVIGGRDRLFDGDTYLSGFTAVSTSPSIALTGAARSTLLSGFSYPSVQAQGTLGRVGPNFQFTSVAGVPEPATWAFMILGFGAIGGALRSRRRTRVSVAYAI